MFRIIIKFNSYFKLYNFLKSEKKKKIVERERGRERNDRMKIGRGMRKEIGRGMRKESRGKG